MIRRVLVQFHNIVPPKDFGIRIIGPKPKTDGRIPTEPMLLLNEQSGGCRTDQLLAELFESGLRLVDIHLKHRNPEGRQVAVTNYIFSDEGRSYLLVLPLYEDWCSTHASKNPRFKEASPEEQEAYLLRQYQRWCEGLLERFQSWTEGLFCRSWAKDTDQAFSMQEIPRS